MDIYAQNILDRYKEPYYKDKEIQANIKRTEANHSCGDKIEVQLSKNAYSFSGEGCAISMAASDILGDLIQGLTFEQILNLNKEDVYNILGIEISLRRSKCALLGLLAIQNAILEKQNKPLRDWNYYHI